MKKEQKIIELRTAAKIKVAELRTKIAFARSEAAGERSRLMTERAGLLEGLKADSTERFDVLAKYRAKLARSNERLATTLAQLKYEIQQTKSGCEQLCAAAEDDPEPENEQPRQETVYCDGSEHTARIVARRLINKMPHIPAGGYLFIHIIRNKTGECIVSVSESAGEEDKYVTETFSKEWHDERFERLFVEKARDVIKVEDDESGATSTAPISRALDAIFSGNPVEQVENLISDTDKYGKEGEDE